MPACFSFCAVPFTETVTGNAVIAGVVSIIGGLVWKVYATNKNKEIKDYYNNLDLSTADQDPI